MTTTTTGTNGFPVRYIALAVVAAAFAAVIIAISQQAGTDGVQTVSAPKQAASQDAAPSANSGSLADALASGKLDPGFGSTAASAATVSAPAPKIVEVTGEGANYDALIAGKFGMGFGPEANVLYVRSTSSGLWKALEDGKLGESTTDAAPSMAPSDTPAYSGGHQE